MPTPMIGRDRERGVARGAVDRAYAGAGGLLLITGEPGIGKSTLLADVASYAEQRGLAVLRGRAVEGGGTFRPIAEALMGPLRRGELTRSDELWPFRRALGRLLPGWGGEAPPETDVDPALVLGEGVLRLLQAYAPGGCLLAIEDLHWADRDSLAVLTYLADALPHAPVLIAATARDQPTVPGLERLRGLPAVITVDLVRLDESAIDRLIDVTAVSLSPQQRRVVRDRSDGLPLLVTELAAGSADDQAGRRLDRIPPSFATLVEDRLSTLDRPTRELLAAASVLGEQPDWDLVARVADSDPVAAGARMSVAVGAHLLVVDGTELRWRHVMTRDAVRASLLPTERHRISLRVAEAVIARHGPDPHAAELLADAGQPQRAARLLIGLADAELSRGTVRSAEVLLDRAESIAGGDPRLARSRVELCTLTGRLNDALALGAAALDEATGDEHAELALQLARTSIVAARWDAAFELLDRAGRPDDVRTLVLRADAAHGAGRLAEAIDLAARAVELSRGTAPETRCEALCVQGRLARYRDRSAAGDAFARAAQIAAEHGLRPWRVEALLGLGTVEMLEDEDAFRVVEAQLLARDLGLLATAASMDLLLADHALVTGGPEAVAEPVRRLTEAGRMLRLPSLQAMADQLLAVQAAVAGDNAGVSARLAGRDAVGLPPDAALQAAGIRAIAALVAHDLPAALHCLDDAATAMLDYPSAAPLFDFGLWALLATAVGQRGDEARAAVRRIPAGQRRANAGALAYADAVAAGREGAASGAARWFDEGERLLAPTPWWQRLLRLVTLESAVTDGWGTPIPLLRSDLAAFEARGEVGLARWCRDLLRRAGAATRRGRGDSAVPPALRGVGVTSRELDVLLLVVEGQGNAAIAARLFLSPRTVETHVANLLAKSGATNRSGLRAWYLGLTR